MTLCIRWNRTTKDGCFYSLIHSFIHHFILSLKRMYLNSCFKTCYGPGIRGKKDVETNTSQNSGVIGRVLDAKCSLTFLI